MYRCEPTPTPRDDSRNASLCALHNVRSSRANASVSTQASRRLRSSPTHFDHSRRTPVANSKLPAAMKLAEDRNLRFVSLQFTDIVGQVKSVQVPMHQLEEAVERGKWFDGSSIEGFARIAESDMFLVPDLDTLAAIPWEPRSE